MTPVSQRPDEDLLVRFVEYRAGTVSLVHEERVDDNNDSHVEHIATDYVRQGFVLRDPDFRTLAPSQCLRSALEDDSHTVLLVTADEWDRTSAQKIEKQLAGTKRRASDELQHQARPRKARVVEQGPSRYLLARDNPWH